MIRKIEHLGIAVDNLEESIKIYERLLGTTCYKMEEVASEGVKTAFFQVGESKIELLEASNPSSPIAKFLEKKGKGIHHIAFDTDDIEAEIQRLISEDFVLIQTSPKDGADNKLVAFLHPKSSDGILVELCQEKRN
jgi:methylmalonyl-CoA/ethylmalonyl-CoA epimerase